MCTRGRTHACPIPPPPCIYPPPWMCTRGRRCVVWRVRGKRCVLCRVSASEVQCSPVVKCHSGLADLNLEHHSKGLSVRPVGAQWGAPARAPQHVHRHGHRQPPSIPPSSHAHHVPWGHTRHHGLLVLCEGAEVGPAGPGTGSIWVTGPIARVQDS